MTKEQFLAHYTEEHFEKFKKADGLYLFAWNKTDEKIADKLMNLTNIGTFWDSVRQLTKRIYSDKLIGNWQRLAELRYLQLSL